MSSRRESVSTPGQLSSEKDMAPDHFAPDSGNHIIPIAIVGMGMRLPGGVRSAADFWNLLINKNDGRCEVPESRFNIDAFYTSTGKPGSICTRYGHFLREDLGSIDPSCFSMTKRELAKLDPQQRLLLEVVWECMENGGQNSWRGSNIGCYVGVFGEDWLEMTTKDPQYLGINRINGAGDYAISNRISYEYDLKGPSMTIRTACSSAMVGLHEACQAINNGVCSSAIVGGTNLILTPTMSIAMTEEGVLSPDGKCKTFDLSADGYARGEAITAIYIKPLKDALRDQDPIRAVIRSTMTNTNGKTTGMSIPSSEGQENVIRRAYEAGNISDVSRTAYVECHGTGTAVGDPTEAHAVAKVFGEKGVFIGSVKPNVGHTEGASGITSLIKAVLALENRLIPPNINFRVPNPKIPFEAKNLRVPIEATAWPEGRHERISINSFGIGGVNAHAIVDSASSFLGKKQKTEVTEDSGKPRLLVLSSNCTESLQQMTAAYRNNAAVLATAADDLAYTLGMRRYHLKFRTYGVWTEEGINFSPDIRKVTPKLPEINFIFPGQGAQWAGMGQSLLKMSPSFRDSIRTLDEILASLESPPTWGIEEELNRDINTSKVNEPELSQPLCTAIQIALVNLLASWNVYPSAVVGHSSGEIGAAYAAGIISAREAMTISYYRGQDTKLQVRPGAMVALGMSPQQAASYLVKGVTIACENSPRSVTISGDEDKVLGIMQKINHEQPETFCRRLHVKVAYHSDHMIPLGDSYESSIAPYVDSKVPIVPLYSSVTGEVISESGQMNAAYWRRNLESPVLFNTAVQSLLKARTGQSGMLFLEVGPHSTLSGPLKQIFSATNAQMDARYIPTLIRNQNEMINLIHAAGRMFTHGVVLDFPEINGPGKVLTNLPSYQWQHQIKLWSESRMIWSWRHRRFPHHELLGSRVLECDDIEPAWRNSFSLEDVPWLQDHLIGEDVVFPCAAYIALVGEAVRQMTGGKSYSIRRLVINAALLLQGPETIEIMTKMKRVKITDSLDSSWLEFTISSYNGYSWIKNCTGQAKSESDLEWCENDVPLFSRKITSKAWYRAMRRFGMNHGPIFQRLTDITANPASGTASASVSINEFPSTQYTLHPTVIDQGLQLLIVAACCGIPRKLNQACVPESATSIYIAEGNKDMQFQATAKVGTDASICGSVTASSNGFTVLHLQGTKFLPLGTTTEIQDTDTLAQIGLVWKPDADLNMTKGLLRPSPNRDAALLMEKLAILSILESAIQIRTFETMSPSLLKFRNWLISQVDRIRRGDCTFFPEAKSWVNLASIDRQSLISQTAVHLRSTMYAAAGNLIELILRNLHTLYRGETEPLELLLQDDNLVGFYDIFSRLINLQELFATLCHSNPRLRIIEIGAGTGSMTSAALQALQTSEGEPMYSDYTFTDMTSGFFAAAKKRFHNMKGLHFKTLDISKDPTEQGYEAESYDLVIASNVRTSVLRLNVNTRKGILMAKQVLHATSSLRSTLQNVRTLLAPGGRLFLQELCPDMCWVNYIMGILPGWWLGEHDQRIDEPYVSPKRWDDELQNAGFTGADIIVYDDEQPYQLNSHIMSRLTPTEPEKRVTILYNVKIGLQARNVEQTLTSLGYCVNWCALGTKPPANQDIISLVDLDGPFLENISETSWVAFQDYLSSAESVGTLWVTSAIQLQCANPNYGLILGMARTIRSELSIDFATIEFDQFDLDACEVLSKTFEKFQRRSKGRKDDIDFEYVVISGIVYTGRYHAVPPDNQLYGVPHPDDSRVLVTEKAGPNSRLVWKAEKKADLTMDEVEIEMHYVGLNFKDVLMAMGVIENPKNRLGLEGAGIVSRVGPEARSIKKGDRVFVISTGGCFSTKSVVTEKRCARIPPGMSLENAATMPCVFTTVIQSLIYLCRLSAGQSVLIHSACGGVGIAAIQICEMIGATIFATVSSEAKAKFIVENFGIPRNHIFQSRDSSFLPDLLKLTDGRGADVVLNSLSGELLKASWECVAAFGTMVELGRRDFLGMGSLEMRPFMFNRSFTGVDLEHLTEQKPDEAKRLLKQCLTYYQQGEIQPIRPIRTFPAKEIRDAIQYMRKGQHIGKILIQMPQESTELPAVQVSQDLTLCSESSYLMIGGLGGLGRSAANWMVERGARSLVFLSRSAGQSDHHASFLKELADQGCSALIVPGSVAEMHTVQKALVISGRPIKGVLQMSMVLNDRSLLQMSHESLVAAIEPKFQGTWNLHAALKDADLDFFVLFSSISGIVGRSGQANYAAANTFLDAFAQYRNNRGLPASVIDIGIVEDIGYVGQHANLLDTFRAGGAKTLVEQDLLHALEKAIRQQTSVKGPQTELASPLSQITIGLKLDHEYSSSTTKLPWNRDIRMSIGRAEPQTGNHATPSDDSLRSFLANVRNNPMILDDTAEVAHFKRNICDQISSIVSVPEDEMDAEMSLAAMGVDSLVSIEIRKWWRRNLGIDISVLEIMNTGTLARLSNVAVSSLREKYPITNA